MEYLYEAFCKSQEQDLIKVSSRLQQQSRDLPKQGSESSGKDVGADPRSTTCTNLRYLREAMEKENAEWYSTLRVGDSCYDCAFLLDNLPFLLHWVTPAPALLGAQLMILFK